MKKLLLLALVGTMMAGQVSAVGQRINGTWVFVPSNTVAGRAIAQAAVKKVADQPAFILTGQAGGTLTELAGCPAGSRTCLGVNTCVPNSTSCGQAQINQRKCDAGQYRCNGRCIPNSRSCPSSGGKPNRFGPIFQQ